MRRIILLLFILQVTLFAHAGSNSEDTHPEINEEEIEELPELDLEDLSQPEAGEEREYLSLTGKFVSDSYVAIKRENPYIDFDSSLGIRELENFETLRIILNIAPSRYIKGVLDGGFYFYPYVEAQATEFNNISLFLIEAFTQVSIGDVFFFKAGLQQVDWSTAYIWSVTGRLNRLNTPLSPTQEGTGVLGLTFEILSRYISYTFGLIFPDFRTANLTGDKANILCSWLANKLLFSFYDTSIMLDCAVSFDPDAAPDNMVYDFFIGSGINQEAGGFIFYADFGPVYSKKIIFREDGTAESRMDWSFIASFGFNRSILKHGFMILEYNYNSAGFSGQDMKNFSCALQSDEVTIRESALSAFRPGEMAQHHFYLHYRHNIMDLVEIGFDSIFGITDPDGLKYNNLLPTEYISPVISYIGFRNGKISLYSRFYIRHDEDDLGEFALIPYCSIIGLSFELNF